MVSSGHRSATRRAQDRSGTVALVHFPFLSRNMSNTPNRPAHLSHTSVCRREGKLVIEIPESRILALASELYGNRATVSDEDRLLDQVAGTLARAGRSGRERGEAPLDRLVGDVLAEAAHAKAGIQWNDPTQHMLIHE